MKTKSLVLPLLAAVTVFVVPAVRGYFVLSQASTVLLYAEAGYTINNTDIYLTMSDQSECDCRKACEVDVKCLHSAFNMTTNECHLTADPKPRIVTQTGATFLRRIKPSLDGLYYIVNNREKVSYSNATARCNSIPGFRIAQAKARVNVDAMISHFEDVPKWNGYVFIGMIKPIKRSLQWEDGTSVDTSIFTAGEPAMKAVGAGAGLFVIGPEVIMEVLDATSPKVPLYGYLCQANFNYLHW